MKKYEENKKKAQELIDRYDSFHYLYISILKELEIFTFKFVSLSSNYSHKLWKIGVNSYTSCKANNFFYPRSDTIKSNIFIYIIWHALCNITRLKD
jgi:hypothetical protein